MQNKFTYTEKHSFAEVSKNLAKYKFENNFIRNQNNYGTQVSC